MVRKQRTTIARRTGRPPVGARAGEMVRDYPQMSVRLPPDIKARLNALSTVLGRPQWRIISAAIMCYDRELSSEDRRTVDSLLQRRGRSATT
jgi:predicted transcriptional regulator